MATNKLKANKKPKKYSRSLRNLRSYFLEYCTNTSIHGFKYLGERRSTIEKLWWAIFITVSLYYCTMLITKTYQKWEQSPVVVTFSTNEMPIWDVPFPAVTICPRIKAMKSKFNFTEMAVLKNNSEKNEQSTLNAQYQYMSLVCTSNWQLYNDENTNMTINPDAINFLIKVQPDFNHTIRNCVWAGKDCLKDISEMFKPVITSDGICYTFNMLDRDEILVENVVDHYEDDSTLHEPPSEWSVDEGYNKNSSLSSFPRRTIVSGSDGGLSLVLLTENEDLDYLCGDSLQGYNVILHQPGQVPIPRLGLHRIGLNEDVAITVKPIVMKTSEDIKGYSFVDRHCYLPGERKLKFFKIYNQQNCLFECLTEFTRKLCGCVGFFMPRLNTTPMCGPSSASQVCLNKSYAKYLTSEISFKINHPDEVEFKNVSEGDIYQPCNCLPSCESLSFDAEVSQSQWNWYKGVNIILPDNDTRKYHLSKLKIYFKDMQFTTSQRNELYGNASFIANCGGLLGLFTGFSILSLVEVVYFVTLRFTCNFRKHGRRHWSGANDISSSDSDEL